MPSHVSQASPSPVSASAASSSDRVAAKPLLFELSAINLACRDIDRARIEHLNPHRGDMALLDYVVWHSQDFTKAVGLKIVRADEFWVAGHFPRRALLPGVLMIETAAQLASFTYNSRFDKPKLPVFTRIQEASFRSAVVPGDHLFILCRDVKFSPKRFISDVQGLVNGKPAFEARITGMSGQEGDPNDLV
ncbi:MAG: 3-hydroxyacyl-ACP dehydratase FabZ family protein [Phycisphaerales bacterium]